MKRSALVQQIKESMPRDFHGTPPWWHRVTPEQMVEMNAILAAWRAGDLGPRRRTAARAISRGLATIGISIGEQGVDKWLQQAR